VQAKRALIVAALICACAACAQPAPKARTERILTKEGTVTTTFVPRATASDVAVAFYPHARVMSGSRYLVKTADGKVAKLRAEVTLRSKDQPTKIARFYQKALPGAQLRWDKPGTKAALWRKTDGKTWIVTIERASVHIRHSESLAAVHLPEPRGPRPMSPRRKA
jgi:hypothetical protein